MINLQPFIDSIHAILANHSLGQPGAYRRWNWQNDLGTRDLTLNAYGCADAANILYTIHAFPADPHERAGWVATLRSLQDAASGMFNEATHVPIHTTAHCIAALELFDALPSHPLRALADWRDPARLPGFLDALNWEQGPWQASHHGAGLYAALVLAGEVDSAWQDVYFGWLARENDPATGLWRKGCVRPVRENRSGSLHTTSAPPTRFPHLAGSFHYLFNHEYARRPLPHPSALVETCLDLRRHDPFPLCHSIGFAEADWVYCLTRAVRQSGHRWAEARQALADFAEEYCAYLLALDPLTDDGLNDLHSLFGACCCLAELQTALPGLLRTARPLRLVLDRRPFI